MKFAGPEKVDTRKLFYDVTALIGLAATLGETVHVLQPGTADNIANLLQAIGQFIPTAGVAAAAIVLRRQAKVPGMLEPTGSPADQVVNGLQAIADAQAQAAADIDKVKTAAADALGQVPVLGPLAAQVINGGSTGQ